MSRAACGRCNRYCPTDDMVFNFCCLLNLVNNDVSRETPMLAANRLTQIGNERKPAIGRLFCALLPCRETVCCLPSFTGHLLVCLPHYGLRPVRLDKLRICPFQSRQRQQNISLGCVHKAGLSFAKILNCGGQQRSLFSLSWTQSIAKETNKLVSSALKDRQR